MGSGEVDEEEKDQSQATPLLSPWR